ncbi:MAG: YdcF family protein [Gloeobacterales cyanobacterium]
MLDAALCTRSITFWTWFNWGFFNWLATPVLVVLPLLICIALTWLIPTLPWKRPIRWVGSISLLVYCILLAPPTVALANRLLVGQLPPDSGASAEVIVVLGRGKDLQTSRAEIAAQLWKTGRAPKIFVSGRDDSPVMVKLLTAEGIPQQSLNSENCSQTTEENARFTAILLQPKGIQRILLITDPAHMLRALRTFEKMGFTVIPYLSPIPPEYPAPKEAILVFREYMGLVHYSLSGRLSRQEKST